MNTPQDVWILAGQSNMEGCGLLVEALPKDEQELFRLANGFAIRHNNREQLSHYDDVVWLRWAFYVYLATIHAVVRLQDRQISEEGGS